jgi:hypothetical protein
LNLDCLDFTNGGHRILISPRAPAQTSKFSEPNLELLMLSPFLYAAHPKSSSIKNIKIKNMKRMMQAMPASYAIDFNQWCLTRLRS